VREHRGQGRHTALPIEQGDDLCLSEETILLWQHARTVRPKLTRQDMRIGRLAWILCDLSRLFIGGLEQLIQRRVLPDKVAYRSHQRGSERYCGCGGSDDRPSQESPS